MKQEMHWDWKGIGIVALTAVVVMAIVGRWPAARRVILPGVEPAVGMPIGMPVKRPVRRPGFRVWV